MFWRCGQINIYEKLGIKTVINALDSETVLGGSIIPEDILKKMVESSSYFVEIKEIEQKLSEKIAKLTKNEACLITNGAAAGIAVAVAGCISKGDPIISRRMPDIYDVKNREVIMFKDQQNNYDNAIQIAGGKLVKVENDYNDFVNSINDNTACIVYFAGSHYEQFALPIDQVISISKEKGVPIIIDAAANLPPVSNLWTYTRDKGAELIVFSGGKTLRGPQGSGIVLGKKEYIEYCRKANSPNKGIARSMKISKEEMVGLYYAIKRYINLDHEEVKKQHEFYVSKMKEEFEKANNKFNYTRIYPAAHGQDYPRLKITFTHNDERMHFYNQFLANKPSIVTRLDPLEESIILNPLHLTNNDVVQIINCFKRIVKNNK